MNIKSGSKYVELSDLSLVAALRCHGAVIEYVDRSTPRAIFHLKKEEGIDELIRSFHIHELLVDPQAYFSALKEAKSRLYEGVIS